MGADYSMYAPRGTSAAIVPGKQLAHQPEPEDIRNPAAALGGRLHFAPGDRSSRRIVMRRTLIILAVIACAGCVGTGDDRHSLFRSAQSGQTTPEPSRHSWLYHKMSRFWGGKPR